MIFVRTRSGNARQRQRPPTQTANRAGAKAKRISGARRQKTTPRNRLGPLASKLDPEPSRRPWMAAVHTTMFKCCPGFPPEPDPVVLVPALDPLE